MRVSIRVVFTSQLHPHQDLDLFSPNEPRQWDSAEFKIHLPDVDGTSSGPAAPKAGDQGVPERVRRNAVRRVAKLIAEMVEALPGA